MWEGGVAWRPLLHLVHFCPEWDERRWGFGLQWGEGTGRRERSKRAGGEGKEVGEVQPKGEFSALNLVKKDTRYKRYTDICY